MLNFSLILDFVRKIGACMLPVNGIKPSNRLLDGLTDKTLDFLVNLFASVALFLQKQNNICSLGKSE